MSEIASYILAALLVIAAIISVACHIQKNEKSFMLFGGVTALLTGFLLLINIDPALKGIVAIFGHLLAISIVALGILGLVGFFIAEYRDKDEDGCASRR